MSVGSSTPPEAPPAGDAPRAGGLPRVRTLLPVAVLLGIVAAVTALLAGGSSKPALPGNANAAKLGTYEGLTLNPRVPAPALTTLHNYNGSSFDLASDRGKAVFVTFLYAHCPDVCPLIASNLHNTYAQMTPAMRAHTAIVAVSVDPRGDTPATVTTFVRQHQLTGEAAYLLGSATQLGRVWEAWKVGSQADANEPGRVSHTALIYGISASGKLTTIYSANFEPKQIIHDVPSLLAS
jgi:protein SCO1